jgi:hypothetical protein
MNFLLTFLTPFIVNKIDYSYGYIFAGCNFLAVLLVFFFYYESSNLELEQVDAMYNDPNARPWNSSNWTPVAESTRKALGSSNTLQLRPLTPRSICEGVSYEMTTVTQLNAPLGQSSTPHAQLITTDEELITPAPPLPIPPVAANLVPRGSKVYR